MRNKVFFLITLSLFILKSHAQNTDKKIDNLMFLFVDEKYEDVVFKSENLMQNDKYRKHPLIYLYASKSYYEMSRRPGEFDVGEKESKYPKPLKTAEKYLYKYVKAERKAKKYFPNYEGSLADNKEFFVAIADTAQKLGQTLYIMEKPRKAASIYKAAFKAVPNDPVLQLWEGIAEVKSKNAVEGDKSLANSLKNIDEKFIPSKGSSPYLAKGLLIAEEYLRSKGQYANADKAKKLIEVFKKYDPDELDKKKMEEREAKKKKEIEEDKVMRKFFSDEEDEDNKNMKGKVIIKDGEGSNGNSSEDADKELDKLEKEAKEDKEK